MMASDAPIAAACRYLPSAPRRYTNPRFAWHSRVAWLRIVASTASRSNGVWPNVLRTSPSAAWEAIERSDASAGRRGTPRVYLSDAARRGQWADASGGLRPIRRAAGPALRGGPAAGPQGRRGPDQGPRHHGHTCGLRDALRQPAERHASVSPEPPHLRRSSS